MEVSKKEALKLNKELAKTRKTQKKIKEKNVFEKTNIEKREYLEPVLGNKEKYEGKPCWLTRRYEKFTPEDNRPAEEILKDPTSHEKLPDKPVFELIPEGLWQCQKCGAFIESNPDEPLECYDKSLGGCGRRTQFKIVAEIINPDLWKLPKWEDIPIEELDMKKVYGDMIILVKKCVVFPEEIFYKLFVLWIISTWKTGCWTSVGFPILRGEHDTGKTRALDLIRELGYRTMHAAGTTFPAMVRGTHLYSAGLIVDEASDKLDRKSEGGREMLNFIKPSYRVGSKYMVADKEDQKKIISYKNFGFKAFAGERKFDPALFSRSIDFLMQRDYPEIPDLIFIQDEIDDLQTKLLNYRYKTNDPVHLDIDFVLRGRNREVFESIISTGMHIEILVEDIIEYAQHVEKEREEEFRNTLEWEILTTIKEIEEEAQYTIEGKTVGDAPEYLPYKTIIERIYGYIEDPQERKKAGQRVGYAINHLQLTRKKMKDGFVLLVNDVKNHRRLRYLYRRYQI